MGTNIDYRDFVKARLQRFVERFSLPKRCKASCLCSLSLAIGPLNIDFVVHKVTS
jgi:hypothetical protein